MKIKLIGIIISIMLIATCFTMAQNVQTPVKNTPQNEPTTTEYDVNVPEWTTGNSWSYQINTITIDYEEPNVTTTLHATLDTQDITLTVTDDTGEVYTTSLNAALQGQARMYFMSSEGAIDITVEIKQADLTGTIIFNKSDLGIRQVNAALSGKFSVKINQQPFLPISLPSIPVSATVNIQADSSTPYPIIQFPLNQSNIWGLPTTNITAGGTIESPWLNLLYRINNILQKHWRIVEIIVPLLGIDPTMVKVLSDFLATPEILPVMDIGTILTMLLGTNIVQFPAMESVFLCNNTEEITVPAGTFNAYNISIGGGVGSLYYAPDAGMIIKISGLFSDVIPFVTDLNAELIEYSYP
ncbi:MAG: hypothetical protein NTX92_08070 [Euryarchaeota archaeon]|nr:hypothetical protein [Euryarchaeota archaeon]